LEQRFFESWYREMSSLQKLAALALSGLVFGAVVAQPALAGETHIYTNNTSDAFAWITVYQGSFHSAVRGAWCVPPGKYDKHGVSATIFETYVEVSQGGCQRHNLLARDVFVKRYGKFELHVSGSNGSYQLSGPHGL
jgi:hypothetical protein